MDPVNETLNYLQWGDNYTLPVANNENKLLQEAINKKTQDRNKYQNELKEHQSKADALREHLKYVRDELMTTQVILKINHCLKFKNF